MSDVEEHKRETQCGYERHAGEVMQNDARSDEEVIRAWMSSNGCWPPLTLDALHEVEERLSAEQVHAYLRNLIGLTGDLAKIAEAVHAPAGRKKKALAAVLRSSAPPIRK